MDNQLTIYYSVEDCGDGSAYPRLFDTEKLAKWHQLHMGDGWGEPCTGEIVVKGNDLYCSKLQTKEGHYLELLLEEGDDIDSFVSEFFPDGLPEFTVEIIEPHYYGVFAEGYLVYREFAYPEENANNEGVKKLTKAVNG